MHPHGREHDLLELSEEEKLACKARAEDYDGGVRHEQTEGVLVDITFDQKALLRHAGRVDRLAYLKWRRGRGQEGGWRGRGEACGRV